MFLVVTYLCFQHHQRQQGEVGSLGYSAEGNANSVGLDGYDCTVRYVVLMGSHIHIPLMEYLIEADSIAGVDFAVVAVGHNILAGS